MGAEIAERKEVESNQSGYGASRYNAVRHGILSRHAVLPWEDQRDYDDLLKSLEDEYQPETPTESHLVEELAGIMWRKARVRLAEGSVFRKEAAKQIGQYSSGAPDYVCAALVTTNDEAKSLKQGISSLTDDVTDADAHEAKQCLDYWEERLGYFEKKGRTATIASLNDDEKGFWQDYRSEAVQKRQEFGYEPHTDDKMFAGWLEEYVSHFREQVAKNQHAPAVRQQIIGLSYAAERMDGIARYETHLDRKFERVLAMLLKIKEMNRLKGEAAN